jgi:transposase InsO family protein
MPKPEYKYALVIVDRFSRRPMAYPLRSINAKATCDALLQVFMTFSIPKVISSDCGSNFTSKLTQDMLMRLGCSPRFNTPGHPEASGLVERCNKSLKTMIYKLAQSDPRGWHRLLPFVLWSLREKPSSTTHVSPYTMIYGTLPKGPLSVLKESWAGERELPLSIGRNPEEYLQTLKENLGVG